MLRTPRCAVLLTASIASLLSRSCAAAAAAAAATTHIDPTLQRQQQLQRRMMSGGPASHDVTVDRAGTATVFVTPKDAARHSATVVVTHGLGDSAFGWVDPVVSVYAPALPWAKFILPTAPEAPVTVNGGMRMNSWYDITALGPDADDRDTQECVGIKESRETLLALVKAEIDAGIPADRIVLAGFSQGGALSLYTGLTYPDKLAGVLVKSGYLPRKDELEGKLSDGAKDTPMLILHGEADPLVEPRWSEFSQKFLQENGVKDVARKTYKGLEHSADLAELRDAAEWLQKVLPDAAKK